MLDPLFPRGALNYWKSAFLAELSDAAIEAMMKCFAAAPPPMCVLALERFHGAVTRVDPGATAYQHRAPGFNLLLIAQWADDGQTEECVAWARSTFDELSPFTQERSYVNYLDADDERVRQAYGANLPRLAELKRRYDPANLFRLNQNIRPSTQPAAIPRARLGAPTASSRAEAPRGPPASLKRRA